MQVRLISQLGLGSVRTRRVGDELFAALLDPRYSNFRFAVAYMRTSGWSRLFGGVQALLGRGGHLAGAVGIDEGVTSVEALEALLNHSAASTVFHTVSSPIFHPKIYLLDGSTDAFAVIGSANLTGDGLFRNVEAAVGIDLDLNRQPDLDLHSELVATLDELLDTTHANVQPITAGLIRQLETAGVIQREAQALASGAGVPAPLGTSQSSPLVRMFPPMQIPLAPPRRPASPVPVPASAAGARAVASAHGFMMTLTNYDASHKTGQPGTAEMLIPKDAAPFFPTLPAVPSQGQKHVGVDLNVLLNTPFGVQFATYRFWGYPGKKEWRVRVGRQTSNLMTAGDLIVFERSAPGGSYSYEVTIYSPSDPQFGPLLALCTQRASPKKVWGIV